MSAFAQGSQLTAVTAAIGAPESRVRSPESPCQPLTSQRGVAISALSAQLASGTAGGTQGRASPRQGGRGQHEPADSRGPQG